MIAVLKRPRFAMPDINKVFYAIFVSANTPSKRKLT